MAMDQGIIFAGLTITRFEIEQLIDDVMVFPPVKAGDIIHSCRLSPKYILIIDGAFEACASVWHKEILYALSLNIPVIGAASMGALRAAELYDYGMTGIGLIYGYYKTGILLDDDELAVSYVQDNDYIRPVSDAMINIRETVKSAISQGVISEAVAGKIIRDIKAKSYKTRYFRHYLESCLHHAESLVFLDWLKQDNFIDQKKADACEAIMYVKNNMILPIRSQDCQINTLLFYSLYADINTSSFPYEHTLLPFNEKLAQEIAGSRNDIKYVAVLAKLICVSAIFYDGSDDEQLLLDFFKKISFEMNNKTSSDQYNQSKVFFQLLFNQAELDKRLIEYMTSFWLFLISKLEVSGVPIQVSTYEKLETSKQFRLKNKLFTTEAMMRWLDEHSISSQQYDLLMEFLSLFHYIIDCNNLMYLAKKANNTHWLKITLILLDILI